MITNTQRKPDIEKIHLVFKHHNQEYVLFTVTNSPYDYIFFQNEAKTVRSIIFGYFAERIPRLMQDPKIECIECSLGLDISGGISIDGKDQVEFGISVQEANR
ncbi:MAG: hypothetical protein ACTSWW_03005, partial [Promethearchaeota archaeon]